MRFVIDLYHRGDEAYGQVRAGACAPPVPFTNWLDLLRLLERPPPAPEPRFRPHPTGPEEPTTGIEPFEPS